MYFSIPLFFYFRAIYIKIYTSLFIFVVILEDFYNLLRHRRFGRKSKNEVMI